MRPGSSILAPMVGITDHPGFLHACKQQGCDVVVLPMMFLEGISANPAFFCKRLEILFDNDRGFDFRPIVVQLIGNDFGSVKEAVDVLETYDIQGLNLNMGCPSGRIKALGLGASILDRHAERDALIDAVLDHSSRPVSVKMRLFGNERADVAKTIRFCQGLQDRGIDWVAIHGRTARQGYKGAADWGAIKAVHEATGLPIVGNGDITSHAGGKARVEAGYCNAFMIGRAAMKDPRVFSRGYDPSARKTIPDARRMFDGILAFVAANEQRGLAHLLTPHEIRKWAVYLSFNIPGGKRIRERAMKKGTIGDISALFAPEGTGGDGAAGGTG
ncbi:MAG: tRNA-dihydrouridine synthase family protein [Candidatus Lokiarchaeota archaeon]|nr:tRNA-dihydrouridine synthase family protein [Candidatus Lokiarchaeota archaeon]